ncbi:MAG: hypothetical protein H0W09_02050 [Solirubrobacterales bacterium]|nr:hypothetical protein [Solirubrobacterales bacterium]
MHRIERATQDDDCTVSFNAKIWGINKGFTAHIIEQYPDERILWEVESGAAHTGVVTFHELGENLTRIQVSLDIQPDSMLEKAGRGWRFAKRAVRADLSRFQAYVEMNGRETGAWRGVIEDGEVVEEHDEDYDSERDYADPDELETSGYADDHDDEDSDDEDSDEESEDDDEDDEPVAEEDEDDADEDEEDEEESRSGRRRTAARS